METKIWCLFSVQNQYDQPYHNLEGWFLAKPSIETLIKFFQCPLSDSIQIAAIVRLWSGTKERIGNADYRFQELAQGFINE